MKIKKIASLLAFILGASALAGCTGDQEATFNNYWEKDVLAPQTTLTETLVYNVTFEKEAGLNQVNYYLAYSNGTYTTVLNKKSDGPYEYTTSLTIDVTFTPDGKEPLVKTDTLTSYVHFMEANDELTPISSTKTMHCHTPRNIESPANASDCYVEFYYELSTAYADKKGVCTRVDKLENPEKTDVLNFNMGKKLTYLDNEQLILALRGTADKTTSIAVNAYSPFDEAVQKVSASFTTKDEESIKLPISENGAEATEKTYQYREVTMKLGKSPSGVTQTVWLAYGNQTRNRNVMLRMKAPLSYAFGYLIYQLQSITRVES